ncbi:MAG: ExeM/NucH family extracellular endonuclease [Gemmatimonadales bacterium]|nr:ExeM/NucH family extracellular endonuclease [Gemmatimonadales bacterium]MDZ4389602.1 ExeM/NucH family extracellular endonuclease [Gemmatimonadales bacterium]
MLPRLASLTSRLGVLVLSTAMIAACAEDPLPTDASPLAPGRIAGMVVASPSGVVISQVYGGGGNSGATLTNDFIELHNAGTAAVSLDGWSVQYASSAGTTWSRTNLTGSIAPGGYYLVQQAQGSGGTTPLPTPEATGTIAMSGTNGKVALVNNQTALTGTCPVGGSTVADFVGYGSANCFEGAAATPVLSNTTAAIRKSAGGQDTDNNSADFETGAPAPRNGGTPTGGGGGGGGGGTTNDPITCDATFTPIPAIQGNGDASPLVGQLVVTQGVVVGDHEGPSPTLRGFYIQALVGDGDATTSDGIFVFNSSANSVALGDVIRVAGTAQEFQDQTQISLVTAVTVCSTGAVVTPVDVTLPVASATALERFEGMLVRLPQTLTVTEHFQLGRFGQVVMSSGGRLAQPTNVAMPGASALALQAANDLNRIIVDDALQSQNPDPIVFGRGGAELSAGNTLRGGDQATGIVGVMTYTWAGNAASGNAFRVRPQNALGGGIPNFIAANPRPMTAPAVGGSLVVGSGNVLNYFNTFNGCTNGVGGNSADCRGADNANEFQRQRAKTIAALTELDAAVVGLMEMENDGYGATSAIQDLVDGLNAATQPGRWAFIDADAATGELNALGTDAIKVALIYQPAMVTPVGRTAALNSVAFVNGGDTGPRNRPALAQAFRQADGGRFIAVINHLKSKGSGCSIPDAGDGQGACNAVRTFAAGVLRDWLATDPTDTGEEDVLILGDLNAYAMEDPITVLRNGGYTNLIATRIGAGAYSFAFDGQWGYLDHALASTSLASQVAGVAEWHINADEPGVLDYNVEFKSAGQQASLYSPDIFRVADHDPVVVGLTLQPPPVSFDFGGFLAPLGGGDGPHAAQAGRVIPLRFSLGGNQGTDIFMPGFPASRPVSCTTGELLGGLMSMVGPGASGLSYAGGADAYSYQWKTAKEWNGTCREVVFRLRDETQHTVVFDFR